VSETNQLKLCDFGLSRVIDDRDQADMSLTGGVGTPSYMAPELMRCDKVRACLAH
jgi:serine/threonine protein kinase